MPKYDSVGEQLMTRCFLFAFPPTAPDANMQSDFGLDPAGRANYEASAASLDTERHCESWNWR
jgi:hypothetical protein